MCLNMRPSFCINYSANRAGVNPKSPCNVSLVKSRKRIQLSNISNLNFGKLAHSGFFSASYKRSALLVFISHIVSTGSQEKVVRIAAWPVVAAMKNLHVSRNLAVVNLPRIPMSPNIFVATFCLVSKVAVSVFVFCTSPLPASVWSLGIKPGYEFNWYHVAQICHRVGGL